jgi:hypothetical protein
MDKNLTAFIDDYVWEIMQVPRCGAMYNCFPIKDIFRYNSLNDRTFSRQNDGPCLQIPQSLIKNVNLGIRYPYLNDNRKFIVKDFVYKHKETIIKKQLPIIRKQIIDNKEVWICDLNMLFFDPTRKWDE